MLNKLNFFQKLSLSTGVLAGCAALITSLGATWGFVAFSQQISATILAVVAFINLFFLGKTATDAHGQAQISSVQDIVDEAESEATAQPAQPTVEATEPKKIEVQYVNASETPATAPGETK